MNQFRCEDLSPAENYKFLSGLIIPRAIAWLTTCNQDDLVNAAPFSFFSGVSNQLPLFSVAILRVDGKMKDSAKNLLQQKEAVVHLVEEKNLALMNATSKKYPDTISETAELNIPLIDSTVISTPAIALASVRMESTLYQHIEIKDRNGQIVTDLFILEAKIFHFADEIFDAEKNYLKLDALKPVARLAGPNYATLADEIYLPRP
ncbi:flavin reductase family protein [Enterococcus timonensis]|uniref:flavin reductase family protein n=1 Tax=Enterococcus timonensis TaxID=1852364 RepID=UPI0008DAF048|nr:flavin reductase family protein [Enterococcus timonensis]